MRVSFLARGLISQASIAGSIKDRRYDRAVAARLFLLRGIDPPKPVSLSVPREGITIDHIELIGAGHPQRQGRQKYKKGVKNDQPDMLMRHIFHHLVLITQR